MQKSLKTQKLMWVGILLVAIVIGAGAYTLSKKINLGGSLSAVEVDWRLLGEMDYISGKTPTELQALNGQQVKVPGFMVPLEDNMKSVKEFLLVPSPQACIHVPPPPPNQMIYVKMKEGGFNQMAYGPIWVYGKLKLTTMKSVYGESSFEIEGDQYEPYK